MRDGARRSGGQMRGGSGRGRADDFMRRNVNIGREHQRVACLRVAMSRIRAEKSDHRLVRWSAGIGFRTHLPRPCFDCRLCLLLSFPLDADRHAFNVRRERTVIRSRRWESSGTQSQGKMRIRLKRKVGWREGGRKGLAGRGASRKRPHKRLFSASSAGRSLATKCDDRG